jgi:hypothetical protein
MRLSGENESGPLHGILPVITLISFYVGNILTERPSKVRNPVNSHLKKLQKEIESAVAGVSPEELRQHAPGKWCVAEILEHLYLTYTGTMRGFERVVAAQESMATKPTWKHRARAIVVVQVGYLPSGRESPPVARPRGTPPDAVLADIGTKIAAMDDVISRCEAELGRRTRVLDHPVLGPLTANQWRKFHLVHGRHHVKQIQRLRQNTNQK